MLLRHGSKRAFALDEARFGLISWHQRRWCPRGYRVPWMVCDQYEWLWLYVAIEPLSGESFCLYLPYLNGDCFQIFLDEFQQAYPNDPITMIMDRAPAHRNTKIDWPDHIQPLYLPAYSPELDPTERLFKELRRSLANQTFQSVEFLEDALTKELRPYWENKKMLSQLTGYPWWIEAAKNIKTR